MPACRPRRRRYWWLVACCLCCVLAPPAWGAEGRLALVIGNASYQKPPLTPLPNPVNDARLIKEKLEAAGFEVVLVEDATLSALRRAIRDFGRKLEAGASNSVAVIYYAGHGMQDDHQINYLLPIDAELVSQVDLASEAVALPSILDMLDNIQPSVGIVIIDACRDNPLPTTRGAKRGLSAEPERTGLLIAYSTSPGKGAFDGKTGNSPYAVALAHGLALPGIEIEAMFKEVRLQVMETTDAQQIPWELSRLTKKFLFVRQPATPAAVARAEPSPPPPPADSGPDPEVEYGRAVMVDTIEGYEKLLRMFPAHPKKSAIVTLLHRKEEETLWRQFESAGDGNKRSILDRLLVAYPDGAYADRARQRLAELSAPPPSPAIETRTAAPPREETKPPEPPQYSYVTGLDAKGYNWLALRDAPSFSSKWSPTKLGPGTLLTVMETDGEWSHVKLLSGETGWANSKYIACCQSGPAAPPSAEAAPPRATASAAEAGRFHYVTGLDPNGYNWLALRSAPDFLAPWSATRMGPGTLLTILDQNGGWYRVRLQTGEVGWANSKFIACCRAAN